MKIARPPSKQPIPDDARRVFKGVLFDVYQWEQELYDGTKATFEKLRRPDTVVVFPVMNDGRILLTEQEQPGKAPFVAATGGRVDEGEDVLQAAKRELREESGYEASEFILWDAQQPVSKIDWAVYTFVAKGLKKVADIHLDAGEKITLKPAAFNEFVEIALRGNFYEKEIVPRVYEAKLHPERMEELRKLLSPS
ncbi:MAG: NUDIX hydrolase [Parcubacteria group bacterium GW2011_GWA1_59_11]|nr:MAG: NUDIX hydrolase [Parcubacteria group bacterium GW2011_GWA1_59_11]